MGAPGSHGFCRTPCLTELARRLSPGGDGGCKSRTRRRDLGIFGESTRDPSGRKDGAPRARRRTAASKCLCTGVRAGKLSSQRHRKVKGIPCSDQSLSKRDGSCRRPLYKFRTENKRFTQIKR